MAQLSVADDDPEGPPERSTRAAGLAWMMVANVLFAIMTIAARMASRSAEWATVAGARAFVGGLVALAFAIKARKSLRSRRPRLSWARSILGTVSMLTTFYALSSHELAVGDALTLFATTPIFIALLSPVVLGERPGRGLWAILMLAFAGVSLVAGPHLSSGGLPAASAFCAAVFSAFAMMTLRLMRRDAPGAEPESPEAIAFHFAAVSFTVHAAISLFVWRDPAPVDWWFLALAGLSGGLAQLAMTRAYALAQAAQLGAISYLGTVLGFLLAVVLLGERPEWSQIGGAILVVTAGVLLARTTAA